MLKLNTMTDERSWAIEMIWCYVSCHLIYYALLWNECRPCYKVSCRKVSGTSFNTVYIKPTTNVDSFYHVTYELTRTRRWAHVPKVYRMSPVILNVGCIKPLIIVILHWKHG